MKHFIGIEDYQIKPQFKRGNSNNAMKTIMNSALKKTFSRKKKLSSTGSSGGQGKKRLDSRQLCIAKMRYGNYKGQNKEQLKYIQREGVGIDGQKPELFGCVEEYEKNMVDRNFRVFISPESQEVDLQVLAERTIKKFELQTDCNFYWVAAAHYNTDNPHVHLLINGVDKNGKKVFFQPEFVKQQMRSITRDVCTEMVGNRSRAEIKQAYEKTFNVNYFTVIDQRIKKLSKNNELNPYECGAGKFKIIKRIEHLTTLGLVEVKNGRYVFDAQWEETLRNLSKYNMYLDGKKALCFTGRNEYSLFKKQDKPKGIVTKVYKLDENSYGYAALIENFNGTAVLVPLDERPSIKKGELVSVRVVTDEEYLHRLGEEGFKASISSDGLKYKLETNHYPSEEERIDLKRHGYRWNQEEKKYEKAIAKRVDKVQIEPLTSKEAKEIVIGIEKNSVLKGFGLNYFTTNKMNNKEKTIEF